MKKLPVQQAYKIDEGVSLHLKELAVRLHWFSQLRWIWVALCLVGTLATYFSLVPAKINGTYLIIAAAILGLTNIIYTRWTESVIQGVLTIERMRLVIISQVHTDYIVLALVTYAFGGIETPVIALFLAEIGLVSLFCNRRISFAITLTGAFFALLPLALEFWGIIPVLSLYDPFYKKLLSSNPSFILVYFLSVPTFFLFYWFFISAITSSLRTREHQLEDAYRKLILLNREKSQSTLRAAHELKAPLAAIKSFVYTMRDGYCGELPPTAQKVVLRIGERADLLMDKVVDIIHLSNLKTLALPEIDMQPIDLTKFLKKEIEEAQVLAKNRDVIVEHNLDDLPPLFIKGSEQHLHTAISNLLQNAINYSYKKGIVRVELERREEQIMLKIEDHGIGIAQEHLDKIFEEHFRSNNAVAHNPNGTGLGLPMVKEILQFHHAKIEVQSELEKGTSFTLSFRYHANNKGEN